MHGFLWVLVCAGLYLIRTLTAVLALRATPSAAREGLPLTTVLHRATEMDVTMIGLQNAGKTSLLRVLSVSPSL